MLIPQGPRRLRKQFLLQISHNTKKKKSQLRKNVPILQIWAMDFCFILNSICCSRKHLKRDRVKSISVRLYIIFIGTILKLNLNNKHLFSYRRYTEYLMHKTPLFIQGANSDGVCGRNPKHDKQETCRRHLQIYGMVFGER